MIGLDSVAVPWFWVWLDSTPLHSTRQVVGKLAVCRTETNPWYTTTNAITIALCWDSATRDFHIMSNLAQRFKGFSSNHPPNLHLVLRTCGSHFAHTCAIKKPSFRMLWTDPYFARYLHSSNTDLKSRLATFPLFLDHIEADNSSRRPFPYSANACFILIAVLAQRQ